MSAKTTPIGSRRMKRRNGMTVDELEELAAPSYSLDAQGQTEIRLTRHANVVSISASGNGVSVPKMSFDSERWPIPHDRSRKHCFGTLRRCMVGAPSRILVLENMNCATKCSSSVSNQG